MNKLGSDKFYIELYEMCKCDTKEELNKREGEIIRQIATMNMKIAGRTKKEYQQTPKFKEAQKIYHQTPKFKEAQNKYHQTTEFKEYKQEYYLQ